MEMRAVDTIAKDPFKDLRSIITDSTPQEEKIEKVAQDFESIFLTQIVKESKMFKPSSLFGESAGAKMYVDMVESEYGKVLAKNGGIGLADIMLKQYLMQPGDSKR